MTTSAPSSPGTRVPVPHRAPSTLLGLLLPVVLTALGSAAALSWRSDLPDPVAIHFGPDGPDGFGSLGSNVLINAVMGLVLAVGGWALAFFAGRAALVRRLGVGFGVGITAFLQTLQLSILAVQRGLVDAADTPDAAWTPLLGVAVGLVVGFAVALLVPGDAPAPTNEPVPADAPRVPLADSQRATWVRHVRSRAILVVAAVTLLVLAVLSLVLRSPTVVLPAAVVLTLVVASTASFTVTVDERGIAARSGLGWPRIVVPLNEVQRASAVRVSPWKEFGGWGYRVGRDGRVGIVLRTGDGIEVRRTGGRVVVVTVDDAATGAALLNTLASRRRKR